MNAVFSVARITHKAKRIAFAWGLVALTAPSVLQPMQASAEPQYVPPGPDQSIEQAGFDFIAERPSRRFASPNAGPQWDDADEGAGGFGLEARLGHKAGDTIGRDKSITHTELMPYVISGDHMTFGSFRLFRSTNAELGGSAGLGHRYFAENWNKVIGFSAWYDKDDHRGVAFEQVSMGLELLGDNWDLRGNWYVPTGTLTQELGTSIVADSQRFELNELRADRRTDVAAAANGFDVMLAAPIPGNWAAKYDLEASAGVYNFYSRDVDSDSIWGYRLRVDGGLWDDTLHLYSEVNSDKQTDHAIMFGVSLDWHGGIDTVRRRGGSQKNRLAEFVRRNDHVVTLDQPVIEDDVVLLNPADGLPYTIVHVDRGRDENAVFDPTLDFLPLGGGPAGGDGTFENPFLTIEEAFASDPNLDIVFVGGGPNNVYTDADFQAPLVIGADQSLLGEATGVEHFVDVVGFADPVLLPSPTASLIAATDPPLTRPVLQGLLGTAVTLSNNSELSGFVIDGLDATDPTIINTVNGISADSIDSSMIRFVTITNVSGNGIELINTTGTFEFESIQIGTLLGNVVSQAGPDGILGTADDGPTSNGAQGAGMFVSGGNPTVNVLGEPTPLSPVGNHIANDTGAALQVLNTTGGNIGLANVNIVGDGGDGILIQETAGRVTLGPATLNNSTGSAISILDSSGATNLTDTIDIVNAGDDAFVVNDLAANGEVVGTTDSEVNITQSGLVSDSVGLQLNRVAGEVSLNGTTEVTGQGDPTLLTQPAVNFQNSSGDVSLGNLIVESRSGAGINIGDDDILTEGLFDPSGALSANSPNEDLQADETNSSNASLTLLRGSQFTAVGSPDIANALRGNANIQMLNDLSAFTASGEIEIFERTGVGIRIDGLQPGARASVGAFTVDDDNAELEGAAVRIVNNQAPVSFNDVTVDGTEEADYVIEIDQNNRPDEDDALTTASVNLRNVELTNIELDNPLGLFVTNPVNGLAVPPSAIVITNNDLVEIGDGLIEVSDGRAITAINNLNTLDDQGVGTGFLTFDSISVDGPADFAVFLENNRGDFEITGDNGDAGTGGEIDGVTTAISVLDHDGDIAIAGLEISNSGTGLFVDNRIPDEQFDVRPTAIGGSTILLSDDAFDDFENVETRVFVDNSEIVDGILGGTAAIDLNNVDTIEIDNTLIENYFGLGILMTINETNPDDLVYDWTVINSRLDTIFDIDATLINLNIIQSAMILVDSVASDDEDTTLNLLVSDNILDANDNVSTALTVDWDGAVNAEVTNNDIDVGIAGAINTNVGGAQAALDFEVGDDDNVSNILISTNTINQLDGQLNVVEVEGDGLVNLDIDNNIFELDDFAAVAIELDFNAPDNDINITNNIFNFLDDDATVVFVDGIVGPSDFNFDGNVINFNLASFSLFNQSTVLEFQGVNGVTTLDGDDNIVTPVGVGTQFLVAPNNAAFGGSVEINGLILP